MFLQHFETKIEIPGRTTKTATTRNALSTTEHGGSSSMNGGGKYKTCFSVNHFVTAIHTFCVLYVIVIVGRVRLAEMNIFFHGRRGVLIDSRLT